LDPFFEILGWNIKNNNSKPRNKQEVLVEEALRTYNKTNSEIKVEARKLKVYYTL
jgi:hypothetical protein